MGTIPGFTEATSLQTTRLPCPYLCVQAVTGRILRFPKSIQFGLRLSGITMRTGPRTPGARPPRSSLQILLGAKRITPAIT